MKNQWTDADVDHLFKSLKDEPTGVDFWRDRVWKNIEAALPAETRRCVEGPWYRRGSVLRLGLLAACLFLAVGLWRVQVASVDNDLEDFVSNLTASEGSEPQEMAGLGSEVRCENLKGPVDSDDALLEMDSLYDTL